MMVGFLLSSKDYLIGRDIMNKAERMDRTRRKVYQRINKMRKMGLFKDIHVNGAEVLGRWGEEELIRRLKMEEDYKENSIHWCRNKLPLGRCGCPHCKWETYEQRLERRRERHKEHMKLKHLVEEVNGKNKISI